MIVSVSTGNCVDLGPGGERPGLHGCCSHTSAPISLAHGGVHRYQYGENGTINFQWGEKEEEQ